MNTEERRLDLKRILKAAEEPISASALAKKFSVSRQIIVSDIAIMRAAGMDIVATSRGYILTSAAQKQGSLHTIACFHQADRIRDELYAIVDNGCTAKDVTIEHPVYGQLTGMLELSSRLDVDNFIDKMQSSGASPLSALTDGLHLHTVSCPNNQNFEHLQQTLQEMGILLEH